MADDTEGTDDQADLEEMFEGWFQERMKREDAKRNRNKQPKDFGDFLDRVADAVWERGEERAAARRKEAEDADQEPDRGRREPSTLEKWWGGSKSA